MQITKAHLRRSLYLSVLLFFFSALFVSAQAQTFSVLHTFTNGSDGGYPSGSLVLDPGGNLFGVAYAGGNMGCPNNPYPGCGTAFKLRKQGTNWLMSILRSFTPNDFSNPSGPLLRDPSGVLYGTTAWYVYTLRPSATRPVSVNSPWNLDEVYGFQGGNDGAFSSGGLVADEAGNMYGTTLQGGTGGGGTVFKLSRSGSNWIHTILYSFTFGSPNGTGPVNGVVIDASGNLYGAASNGGQGGCGVIYKVTPGGQESVVYTFTNGTDGCAPFARVIFDGSGNLFGATSSGGANGGGVAFELSPSSGGWSFKTLYSFSGVPSQFQGPQESLVLDAAGNLYGATLAEGSFGLGNVFELTPSPSGWTYTDLYDFSGGGDGSLPAGAPVLDASGNLYGLTSSGGQGYGIVYEIAP